MNFMGEIKTGDYVQYRTADGVIVGYGIIVEVTEYWHILVDQHLVHFQLQLLELLLRLITFPQTVMLLVQSMFKLPNQLELQYVMVMYGMIQPLNLVVVELQYQMPQKQLIVTLLLPTVHHQLL